MTPAGTPSGSTPTEIATRAAPVTCEHQRVGARLAAERAHLVAAHEHLLGRHAERREPGEDLTGGVGLVGQPDLDVLRVRRHARVVEARAMSFRTRQLAHLVQRVDADRAQTGERGGQQLGDPRLRRVLPAGQRHQVELPPVQARRDLARREPALRERRHRRGGRAVERRVLAGQRLAPLHEHRAAGLDLPDLRPAVRVDQEPPGPVQDARRADRPRSRDGCRS